VFRDRLEMVLSSPLVVVRGRLDFAQILNRLSKYPVTGILEFVTAGF
jgi:hypothetical protein